MSYFKSKSMHGGKDNDNDDVDDDHSNNSSVAGSDSEEQEESDTESLKNVDEEGDDEVDEQEVEEVEVDEDEDLNEDLDEDEDLNEDDDDLGEGDSEEEGEVDEDGDGDEEGEIVTPSRKKKTMKITPTATTVKKSSIIPTIGDLNLDDNDSDEDEDGDGEMYLKKFDKETNDNYLLNFHPESTLHNYDEVLAMTKVVRDKHGVIVDALHKTIPYLTKYERARVLGQRAKQINSGASVFVKVPENVIDGYLIAELELIEKRIPFIIRRPLPNGGSEYWSIKDLENIAF
jgi:DNA-directed RNA polymerase I, II, and III subunit RPABC2